MKRELTLAEIQQESERLLSVFDRFCNNNSISYSLGYGALIGAVRHNGPIPWDDDIDIVMTRDNYQKCVKLFNNYEEISDNGLRFYAPELGNSYFAISRICDMKRTLVRKYYQWTDDETGIWIDVFPIDSLPKDKGVALRKQSRRCFDACGAYVPFSKDFSMIRNLKIIRKLVLFGRYNRKKEIEKYLKLINELPIYGSTECVCNIGSPYGTKDIHKKTIFDAYIRVPFGKIEVSIIKQYDAYLRAIYGDYMKLPPLNSRFRGHSDNKYYWR